MLNNEEKYKILNMFLNGKTVQEIMKSTKKTKATIEGYINKEVKRIKNKIEVVEEVTEVVNNEVEELKAKVANLEKELKSKTKVELLEDVVTEVICLLKKEDKISEEDARHAIKRVEENLTERIDNARTVRAMCMRFLNLQNSMIRTSVGGREGITAMTQTASEIAEHKAKKNYQIKEESAKRPHIFRPKTGKID